MKKTPEKALSYGYVIADNNGWIQFSTLRTNQTECWNAFGSVSFIDNPKEKKKHYKKMGFRCTRVRIEEVLPSRKLY